MKNTFYRVPVLFFTIAIFLISNGLQAVPGDPWLDAFRAKKAPLLLPEESSSSSSNLGVFFDGFSVGAAAGVGLFHGSLADYDIFAPLNEFDKYYKFAWRAHVAREIKWGLAAKIQFEKGILEGGRLPGKQSLPVDFRTHYNTIALSASLDIWDLLSKESGLEHRKFFLNGEVGIGLTLYRSLSFWRADDNRVRGSVGYNMTEKNPPTQRYTADTKAAMAKTLNIPIGFMFGYRMNYKTDVTFSYTLNNLTTGNFDTWVRDWAANDKYSFFGLGLRYNFNRDKSQYPEKKVKEPKEKRADKEGSAKWKLFGSKKEDVQPRDVNLNTPIESRQSGRIDPAMEDSDLEEVKLKMFELQLKLFEMQYLLGGGKDIE